MNFNNIINRIRFPEINELREIDRAKRGDATPLVPPPVTTPTPPEVTPVAAVVTGKANDFGILS